MTGRPSIVRAFLLVGIAIGVGCTFAGLGDYPIADCFPSTLPDGGDPCLALNSPDDCEPYRCVGKRCVRGKRDEDGDDAAPTRCGGNDCNDNDKGVPSVEVCGDGIDNDCNGQSDDVPPDASPGNILPIDSAENAAPGITSSNGDDVIATIVRPSPPAAAWCLERAAVGEGGSSLRPGGCVVLGGIIQQAVARTTAAGDVVAFVGDVGRTFGVGDQPCAAGALAVALMNSGGDGGTPTVVRDQCAMGGGATLEGATLPAMVRVGGASSNTVFIAFHDTLVTATQERQKACDMGTKGAHLLVYRFDANRLAESDALHKFARPVAYPFAVEPPGLAAFGDRVFVAAAWRSSGDGSEQHVSIWSLDAKQMVSPVESPPTIFDTRLANPRAAAIGVDGDPASPYVALLVQLGCTESIVGFFGRIGVDGNAALGPQVEIARAQGNARPRAPQVAWTGSEWTVAWEEDGNVAARLFAADGKAISATTKGFARATRYAVARSGLIAYIEEERKIRTAGVRCK